MEKKEQIELNDVTESVLVTIQHFIIYVEMVQNTILCNVQVATNMIQ